MSELLTLQRDFARALREPDQAAGLLARLAGNPQRNLERLAIYRGNAISNVHAALRLAYPVCAEVLGEECFHQLARACWQAQPATEGDLNLYGAFLPDFLAARSELTDLPWLPELARIEWALHEAGMAPDSSPLPFSALAGLSEEGLAGLRLSFQPALVLIPSAWPLASLWGQHQPAWRELHGEVFELDAAGPEAVLIYRDGLRPTLASLPAAEVTLLTLMLQGSALLPALQACTESLPDFDAREALAGLFQRGLVSALHVGETP